MSNIRAAVVAAAVGCAIMGLELTAVRLMAPHFGDSAYVWTNVIGVILVALAVGAWLGGRAAASDDVAMRLSRVLVVGGALVAIVPWVADWVGAMLLPEQIALDAAMGALVRGSLASTLILFAPPVLLAGMATPMLVTALTASGAGVGRASGHVAAWSTLGSLVGTFAATHLAIPGIGSQWTIIACALLLVGAGLLARIGRSAVLVVVPLVALLVPTSERREIAGSPERLAEVESAYQYLVVAKADESGRSVTSLRINEGLDSFHSVAIDGTAFTAGRYYDYFVAAPYLGNDGRVPDELRVLSLGAAAGTFERLFAGVFDGASFDSVELDPAVAELANAHFGGFPAAAQVYTGIDARVFAEHSQSTYDLVLVDAYERQIYIPAHVASREFFEAILRRLESGGVVAVNAGGRTFEDPVIEVVSQTMASVFGSAWAYRVPRSRNFMLVARKDRPLDIQTLASIQVDDDELARILAATARRSDWREFGPGEPVLTDDRPFLDQAQDTALRRAVGDVGLTVMAGDKSPADATTAAYGALRVGDLDLLGAELAASSEPTGALRFYAGDWRWLRHDLRGALLEYEDARALGVDDDLSASLEQRIGAASAEVAKLDHAHELEVSANWVALCAVLLLAAGVALAARGLRPVA